MTDGDLALWMQGAMTVIGERLPTPLEWQMMKEKIDFIVANRVRDLLVDAYNFDLHKAALRHAVK